MKTPARWILFVLGLLGFAVAGSLAMRDSMPPKDVRLVEGYTPWSKETLEIARALPVQDGGRVKPLTTYANFTMLRLFGARSMKIVAEEGGEEIRVKPLAWMLDAFFRPHLSMQQPIFRIDDSAALKAIGVEPRGRRDRYSYEEIAVGRERLAELSQTYNELPKESRGALERQVLTLAENLYSYEQVLGSFDLLRRGVEMIPLGKEGEEESKAQRADVSSVMVTAPVIRQVLQESRAQGKDIPKHVEHMLHQVLEGANSGKFGVFLYPPKAADDDHWQSPGEKVMNVISMSEPNVEAAIKDIKETETLVRSLETGEEAFQESLAQLKSDIAARAMERGEYQKVEEEAVYYQKNWLLYALIWFLLATPLAIAMWMIGGKLGKLLAWGVGGFTALGWSYVVISIVKRSLIMQRPPVGNLYDTIIFIAATVIFLGAVIEYFSRRRLALGVLPIAGVLLVLLARLFEVGEASDHMNPLIAVLRSNYWLTLHVITITLGYGGGFIAALMGMVYVLLRGLRLDKGDKSLRRSLTRSVYGMICLTLCLSLLGTVLGGIWANDSWGRFWGWDPKENGALMIVLTTLAILHARLGGFLREWGMNLSAIFLAAVVSFSWWHVNMLDTGLHNYGFTEGRDIIMLVYAVIGLFLAFGLIARALEKWEAEKIALAKKQGKHSASQEQAIPKA